MLLALLAPLAASLPIEPVAITTVADLQSGEYIDNVSFVDHTMFTKPAPRKIAGRAPDVQWPFDPVPGSGESIDDPENYHCNNLASQFNQIPPTGVVCASHDEDANQVLAQPVWYTQEQIYAAFRIGASILYSGWHSIVNFDDNRFHFSGRLYPDNMRVPPAFGSLTHVPIGLGTWHPQRVRLANVDDSQQTSEMYEYPLVPDGPWPQYDDHIPGFDRVLFQMVLGVPLYLGVISYRVPTPNPTDLQLRPS